MMRVAFLHDVLMGAKGGKETINKIPVPFSLEGKKTAHHDKRGRIRDGNDACVLPLLLFFRESRTRLNGHEFRSMWF